MAETLFYDLFSKISKNRETTVQSRSYVLLQDVFRSQILHGFRTSHVMRLAVRMGRLSCQLRMIRMIILVGIPKDWWSSCQKTIVIIMVWWSSCQKPIVITIVFWHDDHSTLGIPTRMIILIILNWQLSLGWASGMHLPINCEIGWLLAITLLWSASS